RSLGRRKSGEFLPVVRAAPALCRLVPGNLEVTFYRALRPSPRDRAVIGADILQLAVHGDMHRRTTGILPVTFKMNGPIAGIKRRDLERHGFGAGAEGRDDVLRIPFHEDEDGGPLRTGRAPVAMPGAR